VHNLQIHEQGLQFKNTLQGLERYSSTSSQTRVLVIQASVAAYLQDSPSRFFSFELLDARKPKKYYQQATYEDKISTFPQPSGALVFQEINCLNTIVTTRSTYDEHLEVFEVCPRGT
jgi:hypothetical protein